MHARLQAKEISKSFGERTLFRNVSLSVEDNTVVCLLGRSGSGKSTLLKIIAGLLSPTHGNVLINGSDVTALPTRKRDLGFVFQDTNSLFPHLSVRDNVLFALKYGNRAARSRDVEGELGGLLERLELTSFAHRLPVNLSGGERQRVAIARTLIYAPKVILFDEPLSSLDNVLRRELLDLIGTLHRDLGGAYLYVTHDEREASYLSTHLAVLDDGHLMQFGSTSAVFAAPATSRIARLLVDWCVLRVGDHNSAWIGDQLIAPATSTFRRAPPDSLSFGYRVSRTSVQRKRLGAHEDGYLTAGGAIERCWPWAGRWRVRLKTQYGNLEGEALEFLPVDTRAWVAIPKGSCAVWG